jgi:hypothetical protein
MVLEEAKAKAKRARALTTQAYSSTWPKANVMQVRPKLKGYFEKGHLPRGFKQKMEPLQGFAHEKHVLLKFLPITC